MNKSVGIPKGMRDFSPQELQRRREIISVIQQAFESFGFQPIETPSMETTETLLGKYGEEGDRLIFKILNSGDFMKAVDENDCLQKDAARIAPKITEKALRYDLTVPFARYVVQHRNEINLPFKRYQIQPVWRADRPQKGRYREFYQCDADVVGSDALWSEVEFIQLYDTVFSKLNFPEVSIKINHRKILSGLAEAFEISNRIIDFTVSLDKLDKIGKTGVIDELKKRNFPKVAIDKINDLLHVDFTDNQSVIEYLKEIFANNKIGQKGVEELEFILDKTTSLGLSISALNLDLTLARGINYYTGTIIEVLPPKSVELGSIGGGGRYDDLTGI
ncbi:MAG: HisS family protein, partial [Flavobacteriaceae bacterium]|nr:HisS family protein [Flavobacteriaceae bacterium]